MATYTVIQDIEAEDKLLGPLSLRQFIYAVIVVVIGFVMFQLFRVNFLLPIPLLPVAILFGVLAAPLGRDQPSEIWLLAKIRFLLKPRLRLWDQSGQNDLVKVTAPKKVEENLTDGLDQTQVTSRLKALANTLDTRGWALKGAEANLSTPVLASASSDRLIAPALPTTQIPEIPLQSTDDMLDMQNNPVARQMGAMVQANDQAHRQAIIDRMQESIKASANAPGSAAPVAQTPPAMPTAPAQATAPATPQVGAQVSQDVPLPHLTNRTVAYGNTHVLQPTQSASSQPVVPTAPAQAAQSTTTPVPAPPNPDILELASNDDLSVATIARQANKASGNDEVVISLR